ncbi:MAG: sulfotransferase family 2 domain-containing protein [Cyanobacteria bacterium P01_D01_bin.50]
MTILNLPKLLEFPFWSPERSFANLERVLILPRQKLVYVENLKAGCTKIRTLLILINREYEDFELINYLNQQPAAYYVWEFGIPDNLSLSKQELIDWFQDSNSFKFTFVRNPYRRLESAYADRVHSPQKKKYQQYVYLAKKIKAESNCNLPKSKISLFKKIDSFVNSITPPPKDSAELARINCRSEQNYDAKSEYNYDSITANIQKSYGKRGAEHHYKVIGNKLKRILGYPVINSIDLDQEPVSFSEFINYICSQNVEDMNEHWQPQTYYIGYDFVDFDFIGKLENFDSDIQTFFNKINAPEYIYRHIKGKKNQSNKKHMNIFWTEELARKVYEKYKSDFETFDYSFLSYQKNHKS